ncbi:MAG: MFS transporter, partial [Candidatus Izimaplasma sp.]|nr:MFS transporter [Candidatus Izimaplasma bacterium]
IASYFYIIHDVSYGGAALFTTAYYLSFTIGRILSGLLTYKIHPKTLIISGELIIVGGALLLILNPFNGLIIYFIIVIMLGLGCAPVYPNMMYLNNVHFDKQQISKIISLQMAIGYMGFGILTPLAGLIFDLTTISLYPFFVFIIGIILIFLSYPYLFKSKTA